jgi:D-alanyl-D-alanine carboxypeptidase
MEQTAHRLGQARDPGLDTQRLQEDTIRLLDKMIDESTKRRRQQKSKSQQQQQQQQQSQQQQSQQQQQQAQQASQQQQQRDSTSAQGNNTPGQDGPLNDPKLGNTASWGNLPAHLREALSQGRADRFSSMYRTLTEEYYRRLAKEPSQQERPK